MPQKKNPDVPELVRGKSGRVAGNLVSLLMLMKSQPLAYNKDNQEDKEPLFDTVDNVKGSLKVFADMIPAISCNADAMREAAAAMNGARLPKYTSVSAHTTRSNCSVTSGS